MATPALEAISEGKTNLTLTPVFALYHLPPGRR